jgi:hypothetical protein
MTKDDKAWTFQHMAYFYRDQLEQLEEVRAVVPKAEFRPILYDTLLRASWSDNAFLMRGANNPGNATQKAIAWSRAGG